MFPYQIYQALSDERIRGLMAEARQYELASAASRVHREQHREQTEPSSRFRGVVARMQALLHVGPGARAGATMTSASGAGPMGCAA